uniref:Cation-transporting ATPase n=1 Tax=Macrostomum lignano TaxID=282301 RepID=A0A1I8I5Z0_9PLAT
DVIHYLMVLGLFALAGFVYTVVLMHSRGYPVSKMIIRALDLITIVVPPALPAAMTVGIVFAQTRLRKAKIFCISPNQINVSGTLNAVCFDKTGTLTEDGLDLWGVLPTEGDTFAQPVRSCSQIQLLSSPPAKPCRSRGRQHPQVHQPDSLASSPFLEAMATCHTLTRIEGELSGDPLDLKMFLSTGWQLEEPERDDHKKFDQLVSTIVRQPAGQTQPEESQRTPCEIGIVRQFTFSSSLQRMSVIARRLGADHFTAYVKGSPEMVQSLCRPETIPASFHDCLMLYTRQGYRVIGLAYKPLRISYLKAQKIGRESVERELIFLGLLVMENRLKPQTTRVIHELLNANIRPVMVTGDNILTALSVARDCDIIGDQDSVILVQGTPAEPPFKAQVDFHYAGDLRKKVREVVPEHAFSMLNARDPEIDIREGNYHLAMTGRSWEIVRANFPHLIPKLVVKGTVFARFSPDQKAQLVEALQQVGYTVGMCGDGANDCGALKAAHAGISLSEAEASVASPFTSKEQNISCVPTLIREGRCALITSFGIFKFMAGYSTAQFMSCLILYYIGCNLIDVQFLYVDLFIITTLSITFGYTRAFPRMAKEVPSMRLMSAVTITSISCQILLNAIFQSMAFLYVHTQSWFYPFHRDVMSESYSSYENTMVFLVSMYQYITMAVVFSKSTPYRRTIFSNYFILVNILVTLAVNIYVTLDPFPWLKNALHLWDTPRDNPSVRFKFLVLGAVLMNFLLSYIAEELIEGPWFRMLVRRIRRAVAANSEKEYERIKDELQQEKGSWPPITRTSSYQDMTHQDLLKFVNEVPIRRTHSASGPLVAGDVTSDDEEDEDEAFGASGGAGASDGGGGGGTAGGTVGGQPLPPQDSPSGWSSALSRPVVAPLAAPVAGGGRSAAACELRAATSSSPTRPPDLLFGAPPAVKVESGSARRTWRSWLASRGARAAAAASDESQCRSRISLVSKDRCSSFCSALSAGWRPCSGHIASELFPVDANPGLQPVEGVQQRLQAQMPAIAAQSAQLPPPGAGLAGVQQAGAEPVQADAQRRRQVVMGKPHLQTGKQVGGISAPLQQRFDSLAGPLQQQQQLGAQLVTAGLGARLGVGVQGAGADRVGWEQAQVAEQHSLRAGGADLPSLAGSQQAVNGSLGPPSGQQVGGGQVSVSAPSQSVSFGHSDAGIQIRGGGGCQVADSHEPVRQEAGGGGFLLIYLDSALQAAGPDQQQQVIVQVADPQQSAQLSVGQSSRVRPRQQRQEVVRHFHFGIAAQERQQSGEIRQAQVFGAGRGAGVLGASGARKKRRTAARRISADSATEGNVGQGGRAGSIGQVLVVGGDGGGGRGRFLLGGAGPADELRGGGGRRRLALDLRGGNGQSSSSRSSTLVFKVAAVAAAAASCPVEASSTSASRAASSAVLASTPCGSGGRYCRPEVGGDFLSSWEIRQTSRQHVNAGGAVAADPGVHHEDSWAVGADGQPAAAVRRIAGVPGQRVDNLPAEQGSNSQPHGRPIKDFNQSRFVADGQLAAVGAELSIGPAPVAVLRPSSLLLLLLMQQRRPGRQLAGDVRGRLRHSRIVHEDPVVADAVYCGRRRLLRTVGCRRGRRAPAHDVHAAFVMAGRQADSFGTSGRAGGQQGVHAANLASVRAECQQALLAGVPGHRADPAADALPVKAYVVGGGGAGAAAPDSDAAVAEAGGQDPPVDAEGVKPVAAACHGEDHPVQGRLSGRGAEHTTDSSESKPHSLSRRSRPTLAKSGWASPAGWASQFQARFTTSPVCAASRCATVSPDEAEAVGLKLSTQTWPLRPAQARVEAEFGFHSTWQARWGGLRLCCTDLVDSLVFAKRPALNSVSAAAAGQPSQHRNTLRIKLAQAASGGEVPDSNETVQAAGGEFNGLSRQLALLQLGAGVIDGSEAAALDLMSWEEAQVGQGTVGQLPAQVNDILPGSECHHAVAKDAGDAAIVVIRRRNQRGQHGAGAHW